MQNKEASPDGGCAQMWVKLSFNELFGIDPAAVEAKATSSGAYLSSQMTLG